MSNTDKNPREVPGHNITGGAAAPAPAVVIDYAKETTERLVTQYADFRETLDKMIEVEVAGIPEQIDSDTDALKAGALIKRFRDLYGRLENTRETEGEPHLRRKNAIDAFFNGLRKMIQAPNPNERRTTPGWIDKLQNRIDAHQNRKEAARREELERARIETERIAQEARDKAERDLAEAQRLQREADDLKAEADRARAPKHIEQKTEVAVQSSQQAGTQAGTAAGSQVHAEQATERAQDARIATLAKPADLVRTRGVTEDGGGVTLTKSKTSHSIVVDRDLLDFVRLGPFFSDEAIQTALNKFARATNYREQMEGAEIGQGSRGVTR